LIYILWGEDEFSLEETLRGIKKNLGEMSFMESNTHIFDGQKLSVNELRAVGEAMPFLASKRLVIVKGLLSRFEPKDNKSSARAKSGTGREAKSDESAALADCIKGLPESTVLVLADLFEPKKNLLQNNTLFNALEQKAEVRAFPQMKGIGLSQWIQTRVNQRGGSISRQGVTLLMDCIGGDLFTLSNEINKLVAFTAGRQIEDKDIRMVVSASQETDIFGLIDAILDRKAGPAERILQNLLQNGTAPLQILALLARQLQNLVQVKELRGLKRPSAEIQTRTGIFSSFVLEKVTARAERYSMDRLKEMYRSLLATDLALKTGRLDGDLALNILAAELCEKNFP
jgi:DNA polymerase III subunit delta